MSETSVLVGKQMKVKRGGKGGIVTSTAAFPSDAAVGIRSPHEKYGADDPSSLTSSDGIGSGRVPCDKQLGDNGEPIVHSLANRNRVYQLRG